MKKLTPFLNLFKTKDVTNIALDESVLSGLKLSIENMHVGFIMTDVNGEIIEINSAAKRTVCTPKNTDDTHGVLSLTEKMLSECTIQTVQKTFEGIIDFNGAVQRCIREKKPLDFKSIQLGSRFMHFVFSPIIVMEKTPTVTGCVILIHDETEQRVLSRSKDEFFSIASHELRTPLTSIRGNASMIRDYYHEKPLDNDGKEMVDDIYDSSVRLIGIVNDFLNVSRLEQGRLEFKLAPFDIVALISEIISEFKNIADQRKITIVLGQPPRNQIMVNADKDRVREVLVNLIGNAFKFVEKGGITVNLSEDAQKLIVHVSDTGRGISPANQQLLFRKFQQAGSSLFTRDTTKGTGLGLYISRMMIEGMGGAIWLEHSEEGKGSTFAFSLPLAK